MIKYIKREIYEVSAKVVDASGGYSNLSGTVNGSQISFPLSFDSHQNNDDCEKAYLKAMKAYSDAEGLGYTAAQSGRPLTLITLTRINDGKQLKKTSIGLIPDYEVEVPDEEEETPEVGE